ncbi:MAG: 6-carboxytetrahydropterin synthase QueD [Candidatus Rokubacteria bacterium]|nr:6-carboxytetrahydropterin synthase QueD [Candidatus Rokubacteria bacterium]
MDLQVSYTFDAAHRIRGHAGKCASLHGHTYHLEVTVTAEALDPLDMVMDFDDLREVVRKAVLDRWDHATLLAADDPLAPAIVAVQGEAPDRVVRLDGNPTAELLTREAWNAIERALPAHVSLERVGIRETPMCGAFLTRKPA